ncbi:glycosyltransferase family 4 protein [Lentibacillus salinarum]
MKIVQFVTRMDVLGGAQIHVRDLSIGLANDGCEVIVIALGKGPITEELTDHGISFVPLNHLVHGINPFHDLRAVFEIRRLLKTIKPNLLAIHSSKAGIIGRIAGKTLGIPTVFTAHGWAFTEGVPERKRKLYLTIEKIVGKFSRAIITVSKYDYNLALKHNVIPGSKMKVIHNGIPDVPHIKRSKPEKHPPKLMMVARFAFPKDHLLLLKALERLQALEWELDFVGDGPMRKEVETYSSHYTFSDRIRFLGDRGDVADLAVQSQVCILTTKLEGLPLSIIEGMRSGIPVIATDVGGVSEMVEDNVNGYLVPKDDIDILADRLKMLILNPNLREQMGRRSRQKYEAGFSFEGMLEDTFSYYRMLMQSNGK